MSIAFLFLNGRQSLPHYWRAGLPINCLKAVACRWPWFVWRWFSSVWSATGKVNPCWWSLFCRHCGLPDLCSTVPRFCSDDGNRPQLRSRFCSRTARIYELHFWRIAGHQSVWRNGRQNGVARRLLSADGGIVCCILFCYLSHRGALELEQQRKMLSKRKHHSSWRMPGNSFRSHKKCQRCWHFDKLR